MAHKVYATDEIARRGEEIYDERIREKVESANKGKFLVINIDTGDYEIDSDDVAALERADAKHPDGLFYMLRIGYPAAHHLGGRLALQGRLPAPDPHDWLRTVGTIPDDEVTREINTAAEHFRRSR